MKVKFTQIPKALLIISTKPIISGKKLITAIATTNNKFTSSD